MAQVSFFLHYFSEVKQKKKENPDYFTNKNNTVPIYASITFNGKRFRTSTGIHINPNHWGSDGKTILAKERNSVELNRRIRTLEKKLIDMQNKADNDEIHLTIDYIKQHLTYNNTDLNKQYDEKYFYQCFDEFLNTSNDKGKGTIKIYNNTLAHLKRFSVSFKQPLTFAAIDNNFYDKLLNYFFKKQRITTQTAGKYIKNLKAFLNWSYIKKYNQQTIFKGFNHFRNERQIVIWLDFEELQKIYHLKLDNERLEKIKDLFVFACFTGFRYSDLVNMDSATIQNDCIVLTVMKTTAPQYTPINPYSEKILKKYNYKLPKLSLDKFNDYTKEIAKLAGLERTITKVNFIGKERIEKTKPLYDYITSKTAKKTFVSLFIRGGGSMENLMKTTGNKDRETMKHYYDIMQTDVKRDSDMVFNKLNL